MAMQSAMAANAVASDTPSEDCPDALPVPTLVIRHSPLWNVLRLQSEA